LYNTNGGWVETTINYSNAPALGNILGSSGAFSANNWTQVDITSLVTSSGTYNVAMATTNNTAESFSSSNGSNPPKVILRVAGIPPDNDDFANNFTISSLPYTNTQTNESATLENSEQSGDCEGSANIRNTVWYKYTATADQQIGFSVTGSSIVKGISVWTGSALGSLTQVGCATPATTASSVVNTSNGADYYIRVGTSNGVTDNNLTLQVGVTPANDDFASAMVINTGFAPFSDAQDVIGASLQPGDPAATCGGAAFRTVWYKYISLGQNVLTLNTMGSSYDTVLSVWTGNGLGALTQAGCNDNTGALKTSALTVNTMPDVTYFIRVSSKGGSLSNLTFNMSAASAAGVSPLRNYFTISTPTLTWNRVVGATQYRVQISDSSTFAVLMYPTVVVPASQLSIDTDPLPEGVYYWRVSAVKGGVVGAFSAPDSFIIDLP
jgi:hypothetical protein